MWTALKSDLVPAVHPLREWLNGLRPWSSSEPDWIDMVAQKVVVKGDGQLAIGNRQEYWRKCFKKWFVAMVASWMKDEVVNHTVLVLVGRQGIYKTTWLDRLMPPELRAYSSKLPLSGQISKDDRLRLCENGLLNIDELDAICGREMNIVKSLLTSTDVNERAAYGRLKERRVRLASFCASTNNREFLTDITGNRRWLPFEVESIQNPFDDIILYERLYAQAKAYVECGYFAYWFDMDEIEVLEQHNEKFRALENEEELLNVYFAVPAADSMNSKFLTTAEISEKLISAGNIKRPMSLGRLGMVLGKHGFIASRQGTPARRGWIVYERDSEEINAERKLLSRTRIASTDSIF
jgi:predicted P-loop ATPase